VQESDSAVFGKVRHTGHLQVAPGGRVRVVYDKGLQVVCDGKVLVQYDPAARTAQRTTLRAVQREMPLLSVLVDPKALDQAYDTRYLGGARLELIPRSPGGMKVELEGRNGLLWKLHWVDSTGAGQTLELTQPRPTAPLEARAYRFQAPPGTRWVGEKP